MLQNYRHTQYGTVIIVALLIGFGGAVVGLMAAGAPFGMTALFIALFIVTLAISSWMTVEVGGGRLSWRMGIGLIGRSIPLSEIAEMEAVHNPWYYGWGMHLTRDGWLYNVSGMEGILVKLADGSRFRLGTDEPQALINAIREARGS